MKRRTPRGLDPEEQELWQRVARTATPLRPEASISDPTFAPEAKSSRKAAATPFSVGERPDTALPNRDLGYGPKPAPRGAAINMDHKAFQKMKRGKATPEARLDLHGMTVAAAHDVLTAFILSAQARGKRFVLVITGKGRASDDAGPIPARTGVLRQQVPHWLGLPPLKSAVLQVAQAHQRHGGSGAYYVYLRRG